MLFDKASTSGSDRSGGYSSNIAQKVVFRVYSFIRNYEDEENHTNLNIFKIQELTIHMSLYAQKFKKEKLSLPRNCTSCLESI